VDEETGLLSAPGDTRALSSSLARLASEPDLRQAMGSAAAARAQTFGVDSMVSQYAALFERLTGERQ